MQSNGRVYYANIKGEAVSEERIFKMNGLKFNNILQAGKYYVTIHCAIQCKEQFNAGHDTWYIFSSFFIK